MTRNLHHANLLVGLPEKAESYVRSLCESLGIKLANNPDFFAFRMATFGIDEARELSSISARKSFSDKKIFLITSTCLTHEAQNALLKTFEEPFPDTHFFLSVRDEQLVLPTLHSRMETIHLHTESNLENSEKFLALSLKDRILFVKKFIDEEKGISIFLDDLLLLLRRRGVAQKLLESTYRIRRFADDTAASPRLILDHL